MKQELINELGKKFIDIPKLNSMIENGKPAKLLGFISWGYESMGLFKVYQGKNIFHHLAAKGALKLLLPKFFGATSADILAREGVTNDKLVELINSPDSNGFTPSHYAILHDPLALQGLFKHGAILTSSVYPDLISKAKVIPMSPLEFMFQSEEKAKSFFEGAISSGFTDIFSALCNEHPYIQKRLVEYLPYIIEEVKRLNTVNSLKVFDIIFANHWFDILIGDTETLNKMMRIFKVLNEISENYRGQDADKIWHLSLGDWSNLLSKGAADQHFTNYDGVKKHILNKCAHEFLNGALGSMRLTDLMNDKAIAAGKFSKLQQFVEHGNLQAQSTADQVAQLGDTVISASSGAQIIDSRGGC